MKAGRVCNGIHDDVSGVAGNAACAITKVAGHVRAPLPPERKSSRAVSRRSWHAGQLFPLPCRNLLGIGPFLQARTFWAHCSTRTSACWPFRAVEAGGVVHHQSGRARCFVVVSGGSRARPGLGWSQQPAVKVNKKAGDAGQRAPGRLPAP